MTEKQRLVIVQAVADLREAASNLERLLYPSVGEPFAGKPFSEQPTTVLPVGWPFRGETKP